MMVSGISTMTEEKLEDIRNELTGTLLFRCGHQGIYAFDRRIGQQCVRSWQEIMEMIQKHAPHLLQNS